MNAPTPAPSSLQARKLGAVNWIGLYTLTRKEIERFFLVGAQTIIAPVISTVLFFLVFSLALDGGHRMLEGVNYMLFLTPGLIMMSIAQNAFANTSSSMVISKVQGNIVDVLMPPLSHVEFATGYMLGGIARGLAVGAASIIAMLPFISFDFPHPLFIVFHAIAGSLMMALLGFIGGIWSAKFDHLATVTNFIIMPATFLSGTFYTASQLPEFWQFLAHINPFFYMIDGFRYGFIGIADSNLMTGVIIMVVGNLILWMISISMLKSGYKLRS